MRRRSTWDTQDSPGLGWIGMPTHWVRILLVTNLTVFILQTLLIVLGRLSGGMQGWASGFELFFGLSGGGLRSWMLWQPLTYMFLHTGIWHVLMNMLILLFFASEVEQQLGSRRFLQLYLTGGLVGAACWLLFNWHEAGFLVGASAAVSAVLIAFATLVPERPITMLLFFIVPVTMKAKWWAWVCVAIVAYSSLMDTQGSVAHLAHLGGMAVGYVFVKWLGWGEPSWPVEKLQAVLRPLTRPRRRKPAKVEELSPEQFLTQQVDPILDKISREGIHSLTRRERKILEQAQEKIKQRSQTPNPPGHRQTK